MHSLYLVPVQLQYTDMVVVHLQFLQLLSPAFIVFTQFVDFGFVLADLLQQLGVSLFTGEEKLHDFLDV